MIEGYVILAERIQKELNDLERLVSKANRAMDTARHNPRDVDLYIDSASLNMHDVYSGFERIFKQIASTVDGNLPSASDWHRELLEQMGLDLPQVRPPALTPNAIQRLDEYLRFRHVVRNVYTFSFDPERVDRLVKELTVVFAEVKEELLSFADFLKQVGAE